MTKQESHCFSCGSIKQVNNAKKSGKKRHIPTDHVASARHSDV